MELDDNYDPRPVNYTVKSDYCSYSNDRGLATLYQSNRKPSDNSMNMDDFFDVDSSGSNTNHGRAFVSNAPIGISNFTIHASFRTKNCFSNNKIISIRTSAMIRSIQNLLLFINSLHFTVILVN